MERRRELPAKYCNEFLSFLHDDRGQDLIEYALIAGFIALGALTLPYFTASIQEAWNTVSSKLSHAM